MSVSLKKFVSGGAVGADSEWAEMVAQYNLPIYVMSFHGTRVYGPEACIVRRIDNAVLQTASKHVRSAAASMGKTLPASDFSRRYLQRDWFIVQQTEMVVAIGRIDDTGEIRGLGVVGGTGYGCQMFFERTKRENTPLRLYVFDMNTNRWLRCTEDGAWEDTHPPDLIGCEVNRIALIGSRDLTEEGIRALRDCFT